ncbi:hypothetical protein [Nocardia brasiliensis]
METGDWMVVLLGAVPFFGIVGVAAAFLVRKWRRRAARPPRSVGGDEQ